MKISVIIPTLNRVPGLALCLQGLQKQSLRPDEVIVVNDSGQEINLPGQKLDFRVIKTRGREGQSVAKNLGARAASGELLVFTDDDCVSRKDWLVNLIKPFHDPQIAVVVGRIMERKTKDRKDSSCDLLLNLPFYPLYLLSRKKVGGTVYVNGRTDAHLESSGQGFCHWGGAGNMAIRKSSFEQVGGFDQNLSKGLAFEEPDLCWRIQRKGGKIFYNGRAHVDHFRSASRALSPEQAIHNLRLNEVYFGLKNIAFRNPVNFLCFWAYHAWQISVYLALSLVRRKYWQRVRGKLAGFYYWAQKHA